MLGLANAKDQAPTTPTTPSAPPLPPYLLQSLPLTHLLRHLLAHSLVLSLHLPPFRRPPSLSPPFSPFPPFSLPPSLPLSFAPSLNPFLPPCPPLELPAFSLPPSFPPSPLHPAHLSISLTRLILLYLHRSISTFISCFFSRVPPYLPLLFPH